MFEFLNNGAGRKVYAIDDNTVLKIARDALWGSEQCKNEINTFRQYGSVLPLCPIDLKNSDDNRVLMKRIIVLEDLPDLDFDYIMSSTVVRVIYDKKETPEYIESLPEPLKNFANKILQSGLTRLEISRILYDVSFANLGFDGTDILILDYGVLKS